MMCSTARVCFVTGITMLVLLAHVLHPGRAAAQGLTDTLTHTPPTSGAQPYSPPGTWLPGQPGFPAAGQAYVDPVFGTTIRRLTNDFPGQSHSDIYSINGFWSADNRYWFHRRATGWVIVDAATGAVVRSGVPSSTLGIAQFDPVNPDVYYYISGADLRQYSVSAGSSSVVKTFPATLGELGGSIDYVDRTGRYFLVNYSGALHVWDKATDTTFAGSVPAAFGSGYAGISPDGQWLIQNTTSYAIDLAGQTLAVSGTTFWTLCGSAPHLDVMSASDGKTYAIVPNCTDAPENYRVDVSLPAGTMAQQKSQAVHLFDYDWQDAEHFACAGTGANQDWCFVSVDSTDDTFADPGTWRPYKQEIVMVQMVPPFTVRRLAHHRSRSIPASYYYQPRPSASWDGTKVAWASNYGYDTGTSSAYADIWALELAAGTSTAPAITALSPSAAPAGSPDFTLTVTGSGFDASAVVQWNGAAQATTVMSGTQLAAAIPSTAVAAAGTAAVTVASSAGTSNALTFTIGEATSNPAPVVTSMVPTSAPVNGAAFTLTVTGSSFVAASVVQWNGGDRPTTFVSPTQLTASIGTADLAVAGTATVQVVTPAPGGGTSSALTFVITADNPVPVVTSLSPQRLPAGSPDFTLTVGGTGFVSGAVVQWNGNELATTFVSSTVVTATVPAADVLARGFDAVRVVNPPPGGGPSNTLNFRVRR